MKRMLLGLCSLFVLCSDSFQSPVPNCPKYCECQNVNENIEVTCRGLSEIFPKSSDLPPNIRSLRLEQCNIPSPVVEDSDFASVVDLTIDDCQLSTLSENLFANFPSLLRLDLSNNLLTLDSFMTKPFASSSTLKHLILRKNKLNGNIPADFLSGITALETLDLSENAVVLNQTSAFLNLSIDTFLCEACAVVNVSEIASVIDGSRLISLHLINNSISYLDSDTFSRLPALQNIDLSHCKIEIIAPAAFSNLKNLKSLNLNENKVSGAVLGNLHLSPAIAKSSAELHLEGNGITTMNSAVVNRTSGLIYIGNNPWQCDCAIAWMRTEKRIVNVSSIVCVTPARLAGVSVVDFDLPPECRCHYGADCGSHAAVVLGIFVPVLIICIVILSCFIYRCVKNKKRRNRERKAFRYSAVYRETVELSHTNSKPTPLIDDMRI